MKQISTGTGLLGLGVCVVAAAFIATHRGGSEAFAQVQGVDPVIVGFTATVNGYGDSVRYHRLFSDGTIQISAPTSLQNPWYNQVPLVNFGIDGSGTAGPAWRTVPLPPTGLPFLTDVDGDREVGGADLAQVILDWGAQGEQGPPMQIDCTINQVK